MYRQDKELAAVADTTAPAAAIGKDSREDFAERVAALECALAEAHLGLENMRRLHQASEVCCAG